jgi:hypothetical protein
MRLRWTKRAVCVLCIASITSLSPATGTQAGESIGVATNVRPQVDEVAGASEHAIKGGDSVSRDEVVKTGPDGSAKIVFTDSTNLSIGGSSRIALTNFVFTGKKTYEKATFQLAKGAFRFATGHSEKGAYEINTPTATLGVRGTVFEVEVTDDKTTVKVISGEVHMCPINFDASRDEGKNCNSGGRGGCRIGCSDISAGGSGTITLADVQAFGTNTNNLINNFQQTLPSTAPAPNISPPPINCPQNASSRHC